MEPFFAILVMAALSGCNPQPAPTNALSASDLRMAFDMCVGSASDDFEARLACTQAIYGGATQ